MKKEQVHINFDAEGMQFALNDIYETMDMRTKALKGKCNFLAMALLCTAGTFIFLKRYMDDKIEELNKKVEKLENKTKEG